MKKRFTDAEKWHNKPWFRKLCPRLKCLWLYLCDNCDAAGVWEIDTETASYEIGEKVTIEDLKTKFKDNLVFFKYKESEMILLPDFLSFQVKKELNPEFHPHVPIFQSLAKYNLTVKEEKVYCKLTVNLQYQDKDKDKEQDKDKETEQDKDPEPSNNNEPEINPEHRAISERLRDRIQERRQQKITEATLSAWDRDVRLMVSSDKRTLADILAIIDECHNYPVSPSGFTWANNIRSMGTLREKWNEGKIFLGMVEQARKAASKRPGPQEVTDEDMKRIMSWVPPEQRIKKNG